MNVISIRRHRPGKGRHAASPSDPFLAGGDSFTGPHPVTREAVKADLEARAELTELGSQPTVIIPALAEPKPKPAPDLPADIRNLPVFRDAIRGRAERLHAGCACTPEDDAEYLAWLASQYADLQVTA